MVCKGCHMISSRPTITECKRCQSIICYKCYHHAVTEVNDYNYDRERTIVDQDELMDGIVVCPQCPVCRQGLRLVKRSKTNTATILDKLLFSHSCIKMTCGQKRKLPTIEENDSFENQHFKHVKCDNGSKYENSG